MGCVMDFLSQEMQDKLIKENQEFRKLMEEHHSANERLLDLSKKLQLSAKEKVEEVDLKKVKLRAKERIYSIVEELKKTR